MTLGTTKWHSGSIRPPGRRSSGSRPDKLTGGSFEVPLRSRHRPEPSHWACDSQLWSAREAAYRAVSAADNSNSEAPSIVGFLAYMPDAGLTARGTIAYPEGHSAPEGRRLRCQGPAVRPGGRGGIRGREIAVRPPRSARAARTPPPRGMSNQSARRPSASVPSR
jgi:hypothetical protein